MKKQSIPMRSSPEFKRMLDKINIKRVQNGKSKKMMSPRRFTLAISRIPHIEDFLVDSDIKDDE